MRSVYLDNAAATPLDAKVLKAMLPYFSSIAANPSSLHSAGQAANKAVTQARKSIAEIINGHADEIIFTSGGTESDNLAINGIISVIPISNSVIPAKAGIQNPMDPRIRKDDKRESLPHVVTTAIEHHAILELLTRLQKNGAIDLTVIKPQKNGVVKVDDIMSAVNDRTVLVSVMYANNEIGTIQPIGDIGRAILKYRAAKRGTLYEVRGTFPLFHSDACQAAGYLDLNVEKLHVDLLTLNGGKIYGPKGIGLLFVRRGVKLSPTVIGGGQERGLRSGTENVPGIVGMAKALELVQKNHEKESKRLAQFRDRLIKGLLRIPKSRLNGDPAERLPNNVNISFMDIEGEAAMLYLDAKGISCSTGSACASTSLDPSHVILALGMSYEAAHGSLRFSLGHDTIRSDIDYVIKVMPGIVEMLRKISPVTLDMSHF
ncbi:MAG: aminotransferase class V-fold PLP-dependent enzyme [Patescibacteria group bacterium]|nr:aminotransferase class V-fold PLP-dependent enzyme [Patescibacteria group bacterium]